MRFTIFGLAAALASTAALAQSHPSRPAPHATRASPPRFVNKFEDWTAATHQEAGQTVCYAFTPAQSSTPALSGRGQVFLTVTDRPGASHEAVALSAGFAYPPSAEVSVQIEQTSMQFYTAQRSAFARDGRLAVAAMEKGRQAIIKSPGPRNTSVTDTFSLRGFSPAFAAMTKACAK